MGELADSRWGAKAREQGFPVPEGLCALLLASLVRGQREEVRAAFQQAVQQGVPASWRDEVLRMAHLFCGFPRAIQGLRAVQDLRAAANGSPPDPGPEPDRDQAEARGRALFEAIYGERSAAVQESLAVLPGYDRWILQHAYGRVLARPALPPLPREFLAVAALAVSAGGDQLISHARGARRLGATPEQVLALVDLLADCLGADAVGDSRQRLEDYFASGSDGGSSATSGTPPSTA